jgi:hypothetical protein
VFVPNYFFIETIDHKFSTHHGKFVFVNCRLILI